jgi:hypothetical protein
MFRPLICAILRENTTSLALMLLMAAANGDSHPNIFIARHPWPQMSAAVAGAHKGGFNYTPSLHTAIIVCSTKDVSRQIKV